MSLLKGIAPGQVHSGFSKTELQQQNVRGTRVYTKLYSHFSRSGAGISSASRILAVYLCLCLRVEHWVEFFI